MINLLPVDAKTGVQREYWLRVMTVWMLLLSVALVLGSLLLLPSYVLINTQVAVYQESAGKVSAEVASYEDVSTALVRANQQAIFIINESALEQFSEIVTLFRSFESDRVNISDLEISRTGTELDVVTVAGVAQDRQALALFRDELLADSLIENVELPISNLARGEDIPFSMTVALTKSNATDI